MQIWRCFVAGSMLSLLVTASLAAFPLLGQKPHPAEQEAIAALRRLGARIELYKNDPGQSARLIECREVKALAEALPYFRRLQKLDILDLRFTAVTDEDLAKVANMAALRDLHLA